MRVGLRTFVIETGKGRSFRFAVVDLDKPVDYPRNYVCIFPAQLFDRGESRPIFMQIFGDKSIEQAKALLKNALESEQDSEVKAEIERRLGLLEPQPVKQITCSGCGRLFQPRRVRRYSQNFCGECMRKRFAGRE